METEMKSSEKSNALRREGNELYKRRNFFDALLKYNESLCYAENDSECAGHAYANRSAIYFEMKLYDECLENIKLALANNYPQKSFQILQKREEKCLMEAKKYDSKKIDNALDFFTLSYPPHDVVPSIANCLEMKCNEKFGRHIITNKSLAVGDVIAIDDPFCRNLKKEFLYQRCSYCFNSKNLSLLPCRGCKEVMFCSSKCRDEAVKNYHHFECPIMSIISSLTDNVQMGIRIFFSALSLFDNSIDELIEYCTHFNSTTIFDETDSRLKNLAAILSLGKNMLLIEDEIIEIIFKMNEDLFNMWKQHEVFIKKFIISLIQISIRNFHEVIGWPLEMTKEENHDDKLIYKRSSKAFETASYPFASLLNHSCAPNICKIFIDGKLVMVVQRHIEKGSQIFDNYGYCFTNQFKNYRQNILFKNYLFKCECEACSNDFSILPSLKIVDKTCFKIAKKISRELSSLNHKKSKLKIQEIATVIEKYHHNFPCLEVCSLIESFYASIEIYLKPQVRFQKD